MIYLLRYRLVWLNILSIIITAAVSSYFTAAVPIFFLLTTNLFDILGYHFTLTRKENKLPEKSIVTSYRIIQLMFDAALTVLLALLFGIVPAACGVILKLFALQDLLYYFFLNEKLPRSWNWLKFTPLGIIKKTLTLKEVIIQALVGIILAGFLFCYFV